MGEGEEDRSRVGWNVPLNRDMRAIGTTKDEVHGRSGWRRIVSAAATPKSIILVAAIRRREEEEEEV